MRSDEPARPDPEALLAVAARADSKRGDASTPPAERRTSTNSPPGHYFWCLVLVASLTGLGSALFPFVDRSDLIMLYMVGIMLAAVR